MRVRPVPRPPRAAPFAEADFEPDFVLAPAAPFGVSADPVSPAEVAAASVLAAVDFALPAAEAAFLAPFAGAAAFVPPAADVAALLALDAAFLPPLADVAFLAPLVADAAFAPPEAVLPGDFDFVAGPEPAFEDDFLATADLPDVDDAADAVPPADFGVDDFAAVAPVEVALAPDFADEDLLAAGFSAGFVPGAFAADDFVVAPLDPDAAFAVDVFAVDVFAEEDDFEAAVLAEAVLAAAVFDAAFPVADVFGVADAVLDVAGAAPSAAADAEGAVPFADVDAALAAEDFLAEDFAPLDAAAAVLDPAPALEADALGPDAIAAAPEDPFRIVVLAPDAIAAGFLPLPDAAPAPFVPPARSADCEGAAFAPVPAPCASASTNLW